MKLALTAIALIAVCAMPAMAKDIAGKPMTKEMRDNKTAHIEAKMRYMFDKMDVDGNGVVNKIEHDAFANTMFRNADRNHNNMVTYSEMKAAKVAEMNEMKEDLRARNAMRDDDRDDRY